MSKKRLLVWVVLSLIPVVLYLVWLRSLVIQSFHGTAPAWFMRVLNGVYPRFVVEKHRFELDFFLHHADQISIRFSLISFAVILFFGLKSRSLWMHNQLQQFWKLQISPSKIRLYTWGIYSCVLFFTYDWFIVLKELQQANEFYRPLLLFQLMHIPFPPLWLIAVLWIGLVAGCLCVLFRFQSVLFSLIVAVLFILQQGWIYSFEKIDHAFALLTYVLVLMPFVLHQTQHNQPQWALVLIRLVIGMIYLQAGLEKLLVGGMKWLAPDTFRNYLYLHPTPAGLWVSQYDWLCVILPFFALAFQLSFICLVFNSKMRWVLLPVGLLFHTGTYILMGVGGIINAWVWLYVVYL